MRDLLELVFEYRRLLAKSKAMAGSLRPHANERLQALERLFGQEPSEDDPQRRRHARCAVQVPATIRRNGQVQPVSVTNLGGGGVRVSPAPNVQAGETALLRIVAEDERKIYQYPVRAGWCARGDCDSSMGMPFVGVPRELPVGEDYPEPYAPIPRSSTPT